MRFDTSNPPGNEKQAVDYLKGVLDQAGIEAKVLARDPQRPNLVARLRGGQAIETRMEKRALGGGVAVCSTGLDPGRPRQLLVVLGRPALLALDHQRADRLARRGRICAR